MPRLRYRAPQSPSRLEERFLMLWKVAEGPPLQREFRFHEKRKWRADFAYLPGRVLIEIEAIPVPSKISFWEKRRIANS
jgi:hypothetical protein